MYTSTATLVVAINLGLALAQSQVNVDTSTKFQTIDGFGFSEAFGFGAGVQNAPPEQQNQTLTYLFSTTEGAGMTILRNRIAADAGTSIAPKSPGSPSNALDYVWNGNDASQVFWSKQARAMGVKYIYADAWSAPAYMKTNNDASNGGYLCGVPGQTCASGDWRQTFADYLVHYIEDYKNEGVTIDFIGFLNEPEFNPGYDSMLSDGTLAASFIPILHKTIESAGLSTGITCCDAEGWDSQVNWTKQLSDAGADQYLARITSHWYSSKGTSPIDTNLRVWETEFADLTDAFSTTWYQSGALNEGFTWAGFIYQGLVECNLSAFLYWIGAQSNGNAANLVNLSGSGSSTTVTPSGSLWAFAMFSRYIRPDAVRIAISGAPTDVKAAAFSNADGSTVIVMLNQGSESQSISLGGMSIPSVLAYVMQNSVSSPTALPASVNGGRVGAEIPGHSVVTFVLGAGSGSTSVAPPSAPPSASPVQEKLQSPPRLSTTASPQTTSETSEDSACEADTETSSSTAAATAESNSTSSIHSFLTSATLPASTGTPPPPAPSATSEVFTGMGTRYGQCGEEDCWQSGACSFVDYTLPANIDGSTCVSTDIWNNGANCGGCISVTYKGKTIIVMVTNETGGNSTHLDMTPNTWSKLTNGDSGGGVDGIEWEWITCPIPETTPLWIKMHGGASRYWFAATVENARYRTAKLEVSSDGGQTWKATTRQDYNTFVLDGTLPGDTATVRVTSVTGSEVVLDNVALVSGQDTKATENYP